MRIKPAVKFMRGVLFACSVFFLDLRSGYSQITISDLVVGSNKIKIVSTQSQNSFVISDFKSESIGEKLEVRFSIRVKQFQSYRIMLGQLSSGAFEPANTKSILVSLSPSKATQISLSLDNASIETVAIGVLKSTDRIPFNTKTSKSREIASRNGTQNGKDSSNILSVPGGLDASGGLDDNSMQDTNGISSTVNQDSKAKVVEVVSEGVGLSKEAAEKDAYRQAIRQVVGMYVDSKTIIENDKLLEDKVLSASNGVIRSAQTIPDSVNFSGGLWRLRSKVTVEVSGVSARLESANITTKKIDGESLFANALSSMEKKENAETLLRTLFAELLKMYKITLKGKPHYDASKGELVYSVELTPDLNAYREFLPRLLKAMDSIAVKKLPDSVFRPTNIYFDGSTNYKIPGIYFLEGDHVYKKIGEQIVGKDPRRSGKEGIVSILTFTNENHTSQKWSNYIVEFGDFKESRLSSSWLFWFAREQKTRYGTSWGLKLDLNVDFIDSKGNVIDVDGWEWVIGDAHTKDSYNGFEVPSKDSPEFHCVPCLMVTSIRNSNGNVWINSSSSSVDWLNFGVYISPLCMSGFQGGKNGFLAFSTSSTKTRRIKLNAEQLKEMKDVRISSAFRLPQPEQ